MYGPGTAVWLAMDVTKESEWEATMKKIEETMGPLDVCCNKWVGLVRGRYEEVSG